MNEVGAYPCPKTGEQSQPASGGRSARTVAEWISLGISILLILGMAAYLVYQGLQPHPPYLPIAVRPLWSQMEHGGGRYLLPLEVKNQGRRTARQLVVEVESTGPEGKPEKREITVDYLGERSTQKVYLSFDRDPRQAQLKAAPSYYQLQ